MKEIQKNPESKYTVIGFSHKNKYYIKFYDVICICGKENKLTAQDLKKNISCGCCKKNEHLSTHKLSKSSEYKSWQSMKERCYNSNSPSYKHYGERGITVSENWLNSFKQFINDIGKKPNKNDTLERIDVNKGYSKENCIWASRKNQANNRRTNYFLTYNGITKTRSEWADLIGVNVRTLTSRCRANKSIEQILKEYII